MSHRRLIDTAEEWQSAVARIQGTRVIGVDIEADGFHRYPERTSLIQLIAPGEEPWLIDPLAIDDLSELGKLLADPGVRVIFHASGFDVRALHRDLGFNIVSLRDTAAAGQLAGLRRLGLGNVLEEVLGVHLAKSKRLQRFDWSMRPLPDDALEYAAGDVAHLFELDAVLEGRLEALGRLAWLQEECERLQNVRFDAPLPPEKACLKMKGARDLSDSERAVLASVFTFREAEARRSGRPPHFILGNDALMALARDPGINLNELPGGSRRVRGSLQGRLREALDRGRTAEPIPWTKRKGRNLWTPEGRSRLARLKSWRKAQAEALDIEPGFVWSAAHLDQVALKPDKAREDLRALDAGDPAWVREWQWGELGPSLVKTLETL